MRRPARIVVVPLVLVASWAAIAAQTDDRAALSLAIRQGNLPAVRAIVEKNPTLATTADGAGFTPLHIAATAGRVDIIEFLLGRGADIEARTPGGQTPLFQTIPLVSEPAFVYLLGRGANLNARDKQGGSILQFALSWRRPAMVDLILSRGFVVDVQGTAAQEMLDQAANAGIESLVTALASKGAALDTGARRGTTLLHSAARGGLAGLARQLLKQGARIDARDDHGLTPLHLAAFYGSEDVARLLVTQGADIEARGFDGQSARDLAAQRSPAVDAMLAAKGAKAGGAAFPALAGPYLGQPEPGLLPRIFAPGIVSSEEHETNITFAPDGRELCFSRIEASQVHRWLLFMRLESGRWTPPSVAPFASGGADFEASYSPDGRRLFFASDRPLGRNGPPKRDMDVWVVERSGAGWGEPRNLGPSVNGPSNEYMPTVDRDGNLYFERYGLNVASWRNGAYLPSEPVTGIANAVNPGHPFVAPDGTYLIFDGRPAENDTGGPTSVLFVSFRQRDGRWSPAVRLFDAADTRDYESCPSVSPDGRWLFFGRDHDIYWASAEIITRRRSAGQRENEP
jgi:ankyrin repeat protein